LKAMFDVLNPEPIIVAASAVGTGLLAIRKAVQFANERIIWENGRSVPTRGCSSPWPRRRPCLRPRGSTCTKPTGCTIGHLPKCAMGTTMAKYAACHGSIYAAGRAIQTMGVSGYICEYGVEKLGRDLRLNAIAPLTNEMALNTTCLVTGNTTFLLNCISKSSERLSQNNVTLPYPTSCLNDLGSDRIQPTWSMFIRRRLFIRTRSGFAYCVSIQDKSTIFGASFPDNFQKHSPPLS